MLENLFEWVNIYPCFAYPGTPLYQKYIEEGRIAVPEKWETYGLYSKECIPLPTKHLASSDVLRLRDHVFDSYYKEPTILSMLEKKFGTETREHVEDMVKFPLDRNIILKETKKHFIDFESTLINNQNTPGWYKGELFV
jgi:anaerobic magnesium-protoporphyrin IX monomethyl ester cyclase